MELKERVEMLEKKVEAIESQLSGAIENDRPPEPPKGSRAYPGEKRQVRALIDLELFKILEIDATRHAGGNISKLLDRILWQRYGKPRLSFEVNDDQ